METNIKFVEAKMAFIREFMNSTRPSSELEDFIKAFDTCKPNPIDDQIMPTIQDASLMFLPSESKNTEEKPKRKYRTKTVTINDGTRLNVHPASKMVKVSFFDRDTYYSSVTAAAQALGVHMNVIKRAATKGTLVNGHNIEYVDQSDLRKSPNTK